LGSLQVGKIGIIVKKIFAFNFQVRLMKDRDKGEHEGYAFVAFNRNR